MIGGSSVGLSHEMAALLYGVAICSVSTLSGRTIYSAMAVTGLPLVFNCRHRVRCSCQVRKSRWHSWP